MYNIDQNNPAEMAELWAEVAPKIEAAAVNYKLTTGLQEEIEDLVQDGYVALVKAVETYDPETYPDVPFGAWLIIKCKGEWARYLRDRDPARTAISLDAPAYDTGRTLGDFVADTVSDGAESVEDQVLKDLLMTGYMDIVKQCMNELPAETAALLRMYYLDGVPLAGLHVENASNKIRTGLRQLRKALIAKGVDLEGGLHYDRQ